MNKINLKTILILLVSLLAIGAIIFFGKSDKPKGTFGEMIDGNVSTQTFSGTYVCLPIANDKKSGDCQFGALSDDGDYYAVNFGQNPDNLKAFMEGEHFTAEGFTVAKETLSSNYWQKFKMKGIFTITKVLKDVKTQGKIDINFVCEHALTYMTFPDSKSADAFVESCKKGEEPNVIEDYIKKGGNMNNQLL